MAVFELEEPSDATTQTNNYNSNVGGKLNLTVSAGALSSLTSWTTFGFLLNVGVNPTNLVSTIIPDIIALAGVVDVVGDQLFGTAPPVVIQDEAELRLFVTSNATGLVSGGADEEFATRQRSGDSFPLGVDDIWSVMILTVPDQMNTAEINQLQLDLKDITGIRTARHITDGSIPERAISGGSVTASAHMRIETLEPPPV